MGSVPTLDQTPPSPPDVSGQQGQSPFAGVGQMLQQKQGGGGPPGAGGPPGGVNPKGALLEMKNAVMKVIDQMVKMEDSGAPFADKIRALMDAWVGSVMSGDKGPAGQGQQPVQSPSQRPDQGQPGMGAGFPG